MRSLLTAVSDAIDAKSVLMTWLVRFDFDSGTLYLNTSAIDVPFDGHTWLRGQALSIDPIPETDSGISTGFSVSLPTTSSALLARALSEYPQGRKCAIRALFFDADSGAQLGASTVEEGICDAPEIQETPQGSVVSMRVETEQADYTRPRVIRYTNADQQSRYSGDRACEFTEQMVERLVAFPSRELQL